MCPNAPHSPQKGVLKFGTQVLLSVCCLIAGRFNVNVVKFIFVKQRIHTQRKRQRRLRKKAKETKEGRGGQQEKEEEEGQEKEEEERERRKPNSARQAACTHAGMLTFALITLVCTFDIDT